MDDFERELKEDFLDESLQLLEDTEQSFLALENDKESSELLDQIFRLAHNLKGTSRAVGFGEVAEFTHEMENLILKVKTGELPVTDGIVSLLLECNDHITHMIQTLKDDMDATFESEAIVAKIHSALNGDLSGEQAVEATDSNVEEVEQISSEIIADESNWESEDSIDFESELEEILDEVIGEEPSSNEDTEISAAALEALKELGNVDDSLLAELESKTETIIEESAAAPEISAAAIEALRELGTCDDDIISGLEDTKTEQGLKFSNAADKTPTVTAPADNVQPIKPVVEEKKAAPKAPAASKSPAKKITEDESIRVSLSRVEKLNNVVGELVILQTVLDQSRFSAVQDQLTNKSISQLGKLSKEIQEISMSLRMVPVKSTLQKMSRIVRDTSKTLDKKVKLTLFGEETEIDKTVLEHLSDPLVHIVRNAVDHGLESTEDRVKSGKDEVGNVTIRALHEGNNLVIEISDDGSGIPADVIRRKATEKGLIKPGQSISDEDIIQYIFHPGFSTKEQVTEVSGRGVGMDVVKTNIEKLSGEVKVKTEQGKGSVFKVVLPLTMAIIDGMVVRTGGEKFIIPLSQVHESLKPTKEIIHEVTGWGKCLNLRGQVLPLFNVGKTLSVAMDEGTESDKIAIIIQASENPFAVLVDDILHQQQVVIKTLGEEIKNTKGFMGSSILGDGKPSFILDLNELYSGSMKKNNTNIKEDLLGKVA
ncbi:chemotaxis protein CheA [Halobacteriovorax sp. HLS]|uniref:chemotaxis protein CheA n=1 Tax=Halobacteriovorax sp. HLS TaxID=2234000 RepID=UPI000FD80291|nr:chemotaxis protein CheA [Halobacteriovorax sp. HLS]